MLKRVIVALASSMALIGCAIAVNAPAYAAVSDSRAGAVRNVAGTGAAPPADVLAGLGLTTVTVPKGEDFAAAVGHRCENFGTTVNGYRAGHCADVTYFTNSIGLPATRGQGQAFCQRESDGGIVQCAGISQSIWIWDDYRREWSDELNHRCGRYVDHNPACPAGRYQNLGAGKYYCNYAWLYAVVRTTIILPVSGATQRSDDFFSTGVEAVCV